VSDLERRVSELEAEVQRLNRRIESMLSRKGGHLQGQLHIDGWIQLEEIPISRRPQTNMARLQAVDAGGVLQVILRFPSGKIVMLGQDT
jgi:hypothetical protein